MMRRVPMIYCPVNIINLIGAVMRWGRKENIDELEKIFSLKLSKKNIFFTNSGISSFYILLRALRRISKRREVIIPAYTAGSLVVAIRKAGLKVILCDTEEGGFNMDPKLALGLVNDNTLALVAVHMFGIGMNDMDMLRSNLPSGVYLIEDCAQAMGTRIGSRIAGSYSDAGFFSFGRGKNFPLGGGGAIATDDLFIAEAIRQELSGITAVSFAGEILDMVKIFTLSIAANPYLYSLLFRLIAPFKETMPCEDFSVHKMSRFQISLGLELASRMDTIADKRYTNGMYLREKIKDIGRIIVPGAESPSRFSFNRFPVIFKDIEMRLRAEYAFNEKGIESSRMYLRPLHHMFDLGYESSAFPNASYLAERLLAVAIHPKVRNKDLDKAANIMIKLLKAA